MTSNKEVPHVTTKIKYNVYRSKCRDENFTNRTINLGNSCLKFKELVSRGA